MTLKIIDLLFQTYFSVIPDLLRNLWVKKLLWK